MHIPDGYLSPETCALLGAAMIPVWAAAVKKTERQLAKRQVPLLALGAAFSFAIMMFNIPVPGGTTAHAVGASLVAIVMGPWAACLGMTVALLVQALLFGDGGVLALGANCFNLAFIMPFAAYFLYQFVRGRAEPASRQGPIAGAIAGYLAINLAALCAAVEFGLQPALFHNAAGVPLYCPYSLSQSIPAMALAHLTLGGLAEAIVTGGALRLAASLSRSGDTVSGLRATVGRFWYGLAALVLLSPLGLLAAGAAWGEWTGAELKEVLHYTPVGLARFSSTWRHALLPDYLLPGLEKGFPAMALSYIVSALLGLSLIALVSRLLSLALSRRAKAGRS